MCQIVSSLPLSFGTPLSLDNAVKRINTHFGSTKFVVAPKSMSIQVLNSNSPHIDNLFFKCKSLMIGIYTDNHEYNYHNNMLDPANFPGKDFMGTKNRITINFAELDPSYAGLSSCNLCVMTEWVNELGVPADHGIEISYEFV